MTMIELTPTKRDSSRIDALPVAIIGAGPIGLAAAAHLVERGIDFEIFESGATAASSMALWRHIRLFSPWRQLIDPAAGRLLERAGWTEPPAEVAPYAAELIDGYLAPLAALETIATRTRYGTKVSAVTREGMDRTRSGGRDQTPFELRLVRADGSVAETSARAVIDASGTYRTPNGLGSNGLEPLGASDASELISHALPDVLGAERERFAGRHTVVVGSGHSAANTLLNLAKLAREQPQTRVSWLIRDPTAARVSAADGDELLGRASLAERVQKLVKTRAITLVSGFEIVRVKRRGDTIDLIGRHDGDVDRLRADLVVNATGFRPDLAMLREVRLDLDDIVEAPRRLAPLIDPAVHTCGSVARHGVDELRHPETGFFIAGMKSYGRAPTFLLATGYEQVRSITAWLAGEDSDAESTAATPFTPADGLSR